MREQCPRRGHRLLGLGVALIVLAAVACEGGAGAGGDARVGDGGGRDSAAGDTIEPGDGAIADGPAADAAEPADAPDAPDGDRGGFDPHHRTSFRDGADLLAYAGDQPAPAQVKFVVTGFPTAAPQTFFADPGFFQLHDEWYWWHLLNGQPVPGLDRHDPVPGLSFATIAEITAFCQGLPPECAAIELSFAGERLYSAEFYDLALDTEPRELGLGSLVHYAPAAGRPLPEELWLFELEYQDGADEATIGRFFALLEAALPADVGPRLRWLARSQRQVSLAAAIRAGGGPYAARVVTYDDLVVPGAAAVYNPGIVAGFVRMVEPGAPVMGLAADEIPVLADIPDELPPVAGIVTAVPQTPLAHLNLLAQSRGTPNAFVAGAATDPRLTEWARFRVPVAFWAAAEGVRWQPLSLAQWRQYLELRDGQAPRTVAVPPVDLETAPYVVDLGPLGLADVPALTPLVGGKAAGVAALIEADGFTPPDWPLAVTVRAYAEHIAPLEPAIEALLADPYFRSDARVRLLALEGEEAFLDTWGDTPQMRAWVAALLADPAAGADLVALIEAGGLLRRVRAQAVPPAVLATLTTALRAHFADLAPSQGLRFRSSSTAEDIEGFNGAGLYVSSTGFLDPPPGEDRTVADALRRTWASYWSFAAFEERRLAGIDHLSGRMASLVHARFDDAAELANGVYTLTRTAPDTAVMVVNTQLGAVSVTNPDGEALPEVVAVSDDGAGPRIDRRQRSSLAPDRWLLDDEQLLALFAASVPLAERWLAQVNAEWPAPQRRSTLVLDFEFRWMEAGWPALRSGAPFPRRLIVKQARTLEAPLRVPEEVARLPFPRDLLAEATRIDQRFCRGDWFTLLTYELYTGAPGGLFPYAREPFNAFVQWQFEQAIPGLDVAAGDRVWLDHTQFEYIGHPFMHHGPWDLSAELRPEAAATAGFASFSIYQWGDWDIADAAGHWFRPPADNEAPCGVATLLASPEDFLRGLYPAADPPE